MPQFTNKTNIPSEHERLKNVLWKIILKINNDGSFFEKDKNFSDGSIPDILCVNFSRKILFVGDAKDAINETVGNKDTIERIYKYFRNAKKLVSPSSQCSKLSFTLITNNLKAANEWKTSLKKIAEYYGFCNRSDGSAEFQCIQINPKTWIVYSSGVLSKFSFGTLSHSDRIDFYSQNLLKLAKH
jgi:hypothetical protein